MKYKSAEKKESSKGFYIGIGVFFVIVICLTLFCMNALSKYLLNYEKGTVEYALNEYVKAVNNKAFDEIYENSDFEETEFAKKQDYIDILSKRYEEKIDEPEFLKLMTKNVNKLYYEIHSKGKKLDTVTVYEKRTPTQRHWVVVPKPPELIKEITVTALENVKVLMNSKELDDSYLSEESIILKQFSGIKDKPYTPKLVTYKLNGLLKQPEITAASDNNQPAEISQNENGAYEVRLFADESRQQALKALALDAAQTYAEYITRDATREAMLSFIYKNCEFYSEIQWFDNKWYSTHSGFAYENISVSKAEDFSNGLFSVDVSFDYIVKRYGKDHPFPSKYTVALIETNGKTMIAGIYPI